jgi:hypothetical protein
MQRLGGIPDAASLRVSVEPNANFDILMQLRSSHASTGRNERSKGMICLATQRMMELGVGAGYGRKAMELRPLLAGSIQQEVEHRCAQSNFSVSAALQVSAFKSIERHHA